MQMLTNMNPYANASLNHLNISPKSMCACGLVKIDETFLCTTHLQRLYIVDPVQFLRQCRKFEQLSVAETCSLTLLTARAGDSWFDNHCSASKELASYTISPSMNSRVPHGTYLFQLMPLWICPPKPCAGYSLRHSHPCRDAFHTPGNPIREPFDPSSAGSDRRKDCMSGSTGRRYPLSAVRRHAVPSCTQVGGKTHSNLHRK